MVVTTHFIDGLVQNWSLSGTGSLQLHISGTDWWMNWEIREDWFPWNSNLYHTDPCVQTGRNWCYWRFEAETKWQPFCRWLIKSNVLYFDSNFIRMCSILPKRSDSVSCNAYFTATWSSQYKNLFLRISRIKIRRSDDRFIFIMEITIPGKTVFILKQSPDSVNPNHTLGSINKHTMCTVHWTIGLNMWHDYIKSWRYIHTHTHTHTQKHPSPKK